METSNQKRNRVNQISAELYNYIHGRSTDRKFYEASVKALVRRILRSTEYGENNIVALFSACKDKNVNSACIRVPRSLDGRMQILNRKVIPHFHFVKIFNLPEIKSYHQLVSIPQCQFPYQCEYSNTVTGELCLNPIHYAKRDICNTIYTNKMYPPSHQIYLEPIGVVGEYELQMPVESGQSYEMNLGGNPKALQDNTTVPEIIKKPEYYENVKDPWVQINYYETNNKCETFKGYSNRITVDGGMAGDNHTRFCLGCTSNIQRTPEIRNALSHIGKGIILTYNSPYVAVSNISNQSVYIQSMNFNLKIDKDPRNVMKLRAGETCYIFYSKFFADRLQQAVIEGTYEDVANVQNMCTVRISFVKGWGTGYVRSEIVQSPCWIEIFLLNSLVWFDSVISQMGTPFAKSLTS